MKTKRVAICLGGLCFALAFAGCDFFGDLFGMTDMGDLAEMSIGGARAMYIAPGEAEGEGNRIFKITADGYAEEVSCLDENGKRISSTESPIAVYDANAKYVIVLFGFDSFNPSRGYLVEKATEAVYDLGNALPLPCSGFYKNGAVVQCDSSDGLFFRYHLLNSGNDYRIRKIDAADPASVISSDFSRDTDCVYSFSVDAAGNGIYEGALRSDVSTDVCRIQKANGGIADLLLMSHWTGPDGGLYFLSADSNSAAYQVKKVSFNPTYAHSIEPYGPEGDVWFTMYGSFQLALGDRMAILTESGRCIEVNNPENQPRVLALGIPVAQVVSAACSSDAYFIAGTADGQGALVKVDPADGSAVHVVDPGTYSFYKMVVDGEGKITFNAIRYSDGVKVIGQIDASGPGPYSVNVVDQTTNVEVVVLERIQ